MNSRYFAKNRQEQTRTFDLQGRIGRGGYLTFVESLIANRENLIKLSETFLYITEIINFKTRTRMIHAYYNIKKPIHLAPGLGNESGEQNTLTRLPCTCQPKN